MKVPLSWLKDYVDIDEIPIEELSRKITVAGLEVEEIKFVGLNPPVGDKHDFKVLGMPWDKELIVVAEVTEVGAHPDADRLVLCQLNDGEQVHTVLTGAPNLYEYKGKGLLEKPLKVAYAKLGATIYDGHKEGYHLTKLKKAKIRGVESYSMICSEKELGISEEHEGIMVLDDDAPVGMPLADYMGDAVLDIAITPNIARDANILGVAREVAAIFGKDLKEPKYDFLAEGDPINGQVFLEIKEPELNLRFVLGLIKNVEIKPSPEWVQRRLRLIDQRPINNVVDVTNYVMFDIGQPLHAFDYDVLLERAEGKTPHVYTRTAEKGEKITTLDGIEHNLLPHNVLVCDDKGLHSIAGIMGGTETEVSDQTTTVLLEGAHWNYINIRKSLGNLRMHSEASYRFSRGVHPAMAERGVRRGLEFMRLWSGGIVSKGLLDESPLPTADPVVEIFSRDVRRNLGVDLSLKEIGKILSSLGFSVEIGEKSLKATTPDHRLDIDHDPIIAKADIMEEIARIYGYDNIPETRMADVLPKQRANPSLEFEENLRDLLVALGLQEIITYRMTSPEREGRRLPPEVKPDNKPYVELVNPIAADRFVMRKSLLSSVLEIIEGNLKIRERVAVFELGHIYISSEAGPLPDEKPRLVIAMTGPRQNTDWQVKENLGITDFYDLKGICDEFLNGLHIENFTYQGHDHPSFHPGKCASINVENRQLAVIGEIHPAVHAQHNFRDTPVLAAAFNLESLIESAPLRHDTVPVSVYPPILEDIALIIDEDIPASKVEALIDQTGGKTVTNVRLFDVYRSEQIGQGKKSLAYSLTYQDPDRTLTDKDVAKLRNKIVKRLERELSTELRDA